MAKTILCNPRLAERETKCENHFGLDWMGDMSGYGRRTEG